MRFVHLSLGVFLLVGLGLCPVNNSTTAQETLSSPYLFYYSDLYQTFLLESPDGTESYRIFDGVMSEDQIAITEIGWAPSNQWFAWLSHDLLTISHDGQSVYPGHLWIVDAQGNSFMFPTEESDSVMTAQWSPTQDVLAITTKLSDPNFNRSHVYLFDMATRTVLVEFETDLTEQLNAVWSPDGTQLLVYNYNWGSNQVEKIIVLGVDGSSFEFNADDSPLVSIQWLPNNQLLATAKDKHTVYLITIQDTTVETHVEGNYTDQWISPLGTYWISVHSDEPVLDIYTIPEFEKETVISAWSVQALVAWSPDNQYALFTLASADGQSDLGLLSLTDLTLTKLNLSTDDGFPFLEPTVHWLAENNSIIFGTKNKVYQYKIADQTLTLLTETVDTTAGLSPDGTLLLTFANCTSLKVDNGDWTEADYPTCLTNLLTDEVTRIAPHSSTAALRIGPMETQWSSDSEWFILAEFTNVGGDFTPYYSVTNRWGDYHRELTQETSLVQWIEDSAQIVFLISQSLPFNISPPRLSFDAHETYTHAVAWHPIGPLVVGGAFNREVTIFDTGMGDPVLTLQDGLNTWETLGRIRALAWLENDYVVGVSEGGSSGYTVHVWDGANTVEPFLDEFPVEAEWDAIEDEVYLTLSGDRYSESYPLTVKVDLTNRQAALSRPTNNTYIVYTQDNVARVVSADTADAMLYLEDHNGEVLRETSLANTQDHLLINFALSSDGRYLAGTGDRAGKLLIWDTASGLEVARYYVSGRNLAFSPDNQQIAVATSTRIIIWDLPQLPQ